MKKNTKIRNLVIFITILITVLTIAIIVFAIQMNSRAEAKKSIEMGNRYLSELRYDEAIACFQQALDIQPKNTEASYALAQAYDGNQMYVYAENVYQSLIEDTNDAEAYIRLAELYIREGKLDDAKYLLEEAKDALKDEEIEEMYSMTNPAPPAVSHEAGVYKERIQLSLIPEESSQVIYYTLDGTEPTVESILYEKPLILRNGLTTLKVMAVNAMGYQSDVAEYIYDTQIQDVEVTVEEYVIEQIIRNYLSLPYGEPIYNDDIEQITELYIVSSYIETAEDRYSVVFEREQYQVDGYNMMTPYGNALTSLNDLDKMPFLERVAIEYQPELDISALAKCSSIKELSLMCNDLDSQDIKVLGGLKQLEKLNLGWNDIDDISPLASLVNLTYCGIWGNRISDISPIANCSQLVYFDFADNKVKDISAVTGLDNVQQLWMYNNSVSDISPVTGMDKLEVLMVRDNPITNPEAVRPIYARLIRIDEDLLNLGADANE